MIRLRVCLLIATSLVTVIPASMPASTRAANSLSVWTQSTAYKVQPTTAPGAGTAATMEGAQGAYEAYQLVVHAGPSPLSGVNMAAGALSDGKGHTVAASRITFYLETMIDFTGVSAIDGSQPAPAQSPTHDGRVPDPLVPFVDPYTGHAAAAPFSVGANSNQPVWLDVAIPSSAAAGVYSGVVTVIAKSAVSVHVPVTLTVWSFALPDMSTTTAYFKLSVNALIDFHSGTYACSKPTDPSTCWISNSPQALQLVKRYQELAHDSRIDVGQDFIPPPVNQNNNQCLPITDWTAYDAAMQPYMDGSYWSDGVPSTRLTVPFTPGANWGVDTCSQAQYTALAAQWAAHLRTKGWFSKAIVYALDEPDPSSYPAIVQHAQWLLAGDPAWKSHIMDTTPASALATRAGLDSVLGIYTVALPFFDMWFHQPPSAYPTVYYGRAQWASSWAKGKQLWLYTANGDSPPYPAYATNTLLGMEPQMLGWGAWYEGATGFLYWDTTDWDNANPWGPNITYGKTGDGVLIYPGNHNGLLSPKGSPSNVSIDGPIPSYRLWMIREGLQDWALFNLASQKGLGSYAKSQVARAYGQLGACTWQGCKPVNGRFLWKTSDALMTQIRHNIAMAIMHGAAPGGKGTP